MIFTPIIVTNLGWKMVFYIFGFAGIVWALVFALFCTENPPASFVEAEERAKWEDATEDEKKQQREQQESRPLLIPIVNNNSGNGNSSSSYAYDESDADHKQIQKTEGDAAAAASNRVPYLQIAISPAFWSFVVVNTCYGYSMLVVFLVFFVCLT